MWQPEESLKHHVIPLPKTFQLALVALPASVTPSLALSLVPYIKEVTFWRGGLGC